MTSWRTEVPCTPAGCVELLQRSGVEVAGKSVVVLGRRILWDIAVIGPTRSVGVYCLGAYSFPTRRSNLVGMPMAQLLLSMDATVTVCHSKSQDVARHLSGADIVPRLA